ncbi:unnamed protein product [Rotaria magnacalcarata]|uniref:Flavin-containing monooxygenase n=1 Tax=Rotaria magnacalcarata TaxID=392030 RepID=A0A819HUD2_9BILA|nr:unnamed protein product [Rotaria magnacalcarata]
MGHKLTSIPRLLLFFICSYALTIIAILIGLISQLLYWLINDLFGRRERRAKRKLKPTSTKKDDEYNFIIIGTGFSGIDTAVKYLSCACDSRQPEISQNLERCADKYDVRRHFCFDTFEGQMCHTAEWDKRINFKNKRVAVVGTGAGAIQVVPKIQQMNVSQLLVFQRTPPWIIPRADRCLITNRIREVTSNSTVTRDGQTYPVDIIVWSTGFEAQQFALPIYGIDGCSLAEQWLIVMVLSLFLRLDILLLLLGFQIVLCTTLLVGVMGQFFHWLIYDSFGRASKRAKRKIKWINNQRDDEYYAIIIGTGFSGLGMAIKLNELGMDNYILIERHGHVGGTWYANKYPGCACDVPSNLYSYSFEPNPKWSHYFSRQPEIAQYLEHCADKYDVRRHIHFNTTVSQLKWIEERQLWQVKTKSNDVERIFYARSVVLGTGILSNAAYPNDIPGIDTFEGQMCHTAEWDKSINFKNKRVAVVGTGASAIQVVPEIQKMNVSQLLVFQRTPPWIIPRVDRTITQWEKDLLARFPIVQKLIRLFIYWITESVALSFVYRWPLKIINEKLVKFNLERQIGDEKFRTKLTPTWEFGCKRMLITNDWYPTLQKPNVQLVTNRIREIKSHSIITQDGTEHPVDIIIWSTGFQAQEFPLPVYGLNGYSLAEQWSQTIQAYRGVTVPNFPNFFILLGPNTALGHNSVVIMIESQINYVAEAFFYMDENNLRSIEIKEDVHVEYNQNLQSKLKRTVWQKGGCHSWYQDAKGNNTSLWPDFTWSYILLMKNFDYKSYFLKS